MNLSKLSYFSSASVEIFFPKSGNGAYVCTSVENKLMFANREKMIGGRVEEKTQKVENATPFQSSQGQSSF
jgi:hypothetical protein